MSTPGWGPSDQTRRRRRRTSPLGALVGLLALGLWLRVAAWYVLVGLAVAMFVVLLGRELWRRIRPELLGAVAAGESDPLAAVRKLTGQYGDGVYLGVADSGDWRYSRRERAVLVLGPPRSGKTSAVIVPGLIAHTGPAVCTSTKTDVASLTRPARGRGGRLWVFDPTGNSSPAGFERLRWSPVTSARSWEQALLTARAMTATVAAGTTHGSHWSNRAQALLAPLLHAAAIDGRDMETVLDWVMCHELDPAGMLLEREAASRLAFSSLVGIFNTEARERASIFSATADALVAYNSDAALDATKNPNFDPAAFVASHDTVYILAPAEEQAAAAPIVCGLLSEIRRATYLAHRQGNLGGRVLFALDEAANVAPLDELPAIASEGGGQGLTLLAAFQDLSQARQRWGRAADGFLTLFGTKLILTGIADTKTLEAISVALGEYDRKMVARTRPRGGLVSGLLGNGPVPQPTTTTSTQRTRVLSAGEVANLPAGRALHLDGLAWELVALTPAYGSEPWKTLTTPTQAATS